MSLIIIHDQCQYFVTVYAVLDVELAAGRWRERVAMLNVELAAGRWSM